MTAAEICTAVNGTVAVEVADAAALALSSLPPAEH